MNRLESVWRWAISVVCVGWRRIRELPVPRPYVPPPPPLVDSGSLESGANYTWVVWRPETTPAAPPPPAIKIPPEMLVPRPLPAEVLRQLEPVSACGAVLVAALQEVGRPSSHAALIVVPAPLRVTLRNGTTRTNLPPGEGTGKG
jgi:hypothetical protein